MRMELNGVIFMVFLSVCFTIAATSSHVTAINNNISYSANSTMMTTKRILSAVSSNANATSSARFLTYENATFGIKLQYPSNWKKVVEDNSDFKLLLPTNSNEIFHILTTPLPANSNQSLNHYFNRTLDYITGINAGSHIIESGKTVLSGNIPAKWVVINYVFII